MFFGELWRPFCVMQCDYTKWPSSSLSRISSRTRTRTIVIVFHFWMSHVQMWMSQVSWMNQSCLIYECVTSTCEWVMSQFGSNRIDFLIASRLLRQDIVSPELTLENFYTDSGRYVGHFLILIHVWIISRVLMWMSHV